MHNEEVEFRAYNFLGFIPNRILIKLKNWTEYHLILAKYKKLTRVVNSNTSIRWCLQWKRNVKAIM